MSRSGYSDDCENIGLWRGTVANAIRGKRGQRLLRDLVAALDAMPEKRLAAGVLADESGCMCSLGAVAAMRQADVTDISFDDYGYSYQAVDKLSGALDIAGPLAQEVMYMNDKGNPYWRGPETEEQRWSRMRAWAVEHIAAAPKLAGEE